MIGPQLAVYISSHFGTQRKTDGFPLYVDQTESLAASLPTHPRWPEAARRAATHVHVAGEHDPRIRQDTKDLIIQHYLPQMNIEMCPGEKDKEQLS